MKQEKVCVCVCVCFIIKGMSGKALNIARCIYLFCIPVQNEFNCKNTGGSVKYRRMNNWTSLGGFSNGI